MTTTRNRNDDPSAVLGPMHLGGDPYDNAVGRSPGGREKSDEERMAWRECTTRPNEIYRDALRATLACMPAQPTDPHHAWAQAQLSAELFEVDGVLASAPPPPEKEREAFAAAYAAYSAAHGGVIGARNAGDVDGLLHARALVEIRDVELRRARSAHGRACKQLPHPDSRPLSGGRRCHQTCRDIARWALRFGVNKLEEITTLYYTSGSTSDIVEEYARGVEERSLPWLIAVGASRPPIEQDVYQYIAWRAGRRLGIAQLAEREPDFFSRKKQA